MTIREALKLGPDSEVLLAHVLKKDRAWLFANPNYQLPKLKAISYKLKAQQRSRGVPAAYLTGHKEFYGLDFKISPDVLIPRPETELLVELALERIKNKESRIKKVIDIGTGSGCIIVSLAVILSEKREEARRSFGRKRPQDDIRFIAIDNSPAALKIAKQNARRHGVEKKIKFIRSDLLSTSPLTLPRPGEGAKGGRGRTIIIANLPYLTPAQLKANPDLKFEPRSALVAGRDGLKYYRKMFEQLSKFYIQNSIFLFEHDPSQVSKLKILVKKYLPNSKIQFHHDLSGRRRVMEINLHNFQDQSTIGHGRQNPAWSHI